MSVLQKETYTREEVISAITFTAMGTAGFLGRDLGDKLLEQMPEDLRHEVLANTLSAIEVVKVKNNDALSPLSLLLRAAVAAKEKPATSFGDFIERIKRSAAAAKEQAQEQPQEQPKENTPEEELKNILKRIFAQD